MKPELLDNSLSLWLSNSHVSPLFFSLSFVFYVIFSTLPQACKEAIWPSVRQRRWQNASTDRHFHSVDKDFTKSFFLPGNCGSICTCCELVNTYLGYLLFISFPFFVVAPLSAAEYYRWIDQNGVVHFTDNLHNIPEKQRPTANRIQTKENPRSPEAEKPAVVGKASVPIEKHGQVVVIEATLNGKTSAKFVVDTGASYTMISTAVARELNIDVSQNQRTMPFQTANGLIQAPLTNLDSIAVGGMEIKNLTAAVHDAVPDPNVSGLLGLNFLSNFRMDIDTQKGVLHLEKK
jgi:clan AA aspartic protease (TIGR02281 family)